MVDPVVSVATALLRAQLPDVTMREGTSVMARVASRGEQHGVLVLAGIPLTAQLPDGVAAGATLKLRVEEVTDEADPDQELLENGALLPGPGATLAGPTFAEWLDAAERRRAA